MSGAYYQMEAKRCWAAVFAGLGLCHWQLTLLLAVTWLFLHVSMCIWNRLYYAPHWIIPIRYQCFSTSTEWCKIKWIFHLHSAKRSKLQIQFQWYIKECVISTKVQKIPILCFSNMHVGDLHSVERHNWANVYVNCKALCSTFCATLYFTYY